MTNKKSTKSKKPTVEQLQRELAIVERMNSALNTAIVAIAYASKVKGNELDKVKPKDYVKFVEEHVHPLVKKADEIAEAYAKERFEEITKAAEKAKKEEK